VGLLGDSSPASAGYAHAAYAASLDALGEPRRLGRSGGSILVREIPGSELRDGMGPYPIFACADWAALATDIGELRDELVAVSLVADPFGGATAGDLASAFGDVVTPFKEHFVVDLRGGWREAIHPHHRRKVRQALTRLEVESVRDPSTLVDDWTALYRELIDRHRITGPAAFSRDSFAAQLRVPGIAALRALEDGVTVGATLWYVVGDVAYYHLGAYSARGYELAASFALFDRGLERFAAEGVAWASLGAGAGLDGALEDGLTRFKRGWATTTRTAYLCGRILQRGVYDELSAARSSGTPYFPAYRAGEAA
jgi:Acetyltransferase (GNAT) domain